uniref:Uncharacterized protein n=1 Tax=Anguilla anguilla TaxID=7936 RepID=A0A0E9PJR6_ANGAN
MFSHRDRTSHSSVV